MPKLIDKNKDTEFVNRIFFGESALRELKKEKVLVVSPALKLSAAAYGNVGLREKKIITE